LNLPFYIAGRYLFAKKSHNAINIISLVSVCGVVVATVAMVCTLSVYNGFKGLTTTLFSVFDPELKITAVEGKVFDPTTDAFRNVAALPEVELCSSALQENALLRYGDRQEISVVKGVDSLYHYLANIDTAIIDGKYRLEENDAYYGVLGIGLSYSLGVNAAFAHPIEIFMPKRGETVNMANPAASARVNYVLIGGVYRINQTVYDEGFMLVAIDLLRDMLGYENEVSAIEIKTAPNADIDATKKKIAAILGPQFSVKDRFEQQEATFKMVQIEKWVTFLMLCFILVMALFNVLGSLAILMIEKEEDIAKLHSMGADSSLINKIFLFEGWMISLFGAVIGSCIGLALCFVQQRFGLLSLGATEGAFIVDAYPVKVEWTDVIIVFLTVAGMGFLAAIYPVHFMKKKNITVCVLSACVLLTACNASPQKNAPEIAVTIEPIRYFAEKIARDDYRFFSVVPTGQGPETYDPTPREMLRINKANALFLLDLLPAEQKLTEAVHAGNPLMPVANLSKGMSFGENSHLHNGVLHHHDPHIWTSFTGARAIASNICQALSALRPDRTAFYNKNCDSLLTIISELEQLIRSQLAPLPHRTFIIFHPALTYFANEFNLRQLSIEEDGKEPSAASMKQLIEKARTDKVKVIFIQKEFDSKYASQIAAETGAKVVTIAPLDYEWDDCLRKITDALTKP